MLKPLNRCILGQEVNTELFGAKALIHKHGDGTSFSDAYETASVNLGATKLRYPGGAIIEQFFDVRAPNTPNPELDQSQFVALDEAISHCISEGFAAQETVRSSATLERFDSEPRNVKRWLFFSTFLAASNLLLSNEKLRLSRYRKSVAASYDPSEQVIRIKVRTLDPDVASRIAENMGNIVQETMNDGAHGTRLKLLGEARAAFEGAQADYASSIERVRLLESQAGVVDPTIETEFLYRMISGLREERLGYEVDFQGLGNSQDLSRAVAEDLKKRIDLLDSSVAELRAEITNRKTAQGAISSARLLLEAAHFEKDLASQKLAEISARLSEADLQAIQRQNFVSVSAPPSLVSTDPLWASSTLFLKSFAIGLIGYFFLSITLDALRREY